MGFAGAATPLDIVCAADEASRSGAGRRLTQEGAQACVGWRRRAMRGVVWAAHHAKLVKLTPCIRMRRLSCAEMKNHQLFDEVLFGHRNAAMVLSATLF